jgi:hypothetical protein
MIEFFLSMFPQYAVLQARVEALRLECDSLQREVDTKDARIDDLQRVADAMAMRATGRRIFSAAPEEEVPVAEAPSSMIPSRVFARDLVRKQHEEFNKAMRNLA